MSKKEIELKINNGEVVSQIDFKQNDIKVGNFQRNYTRKKTKGIGNKQNIYSIIYNNNDRNNLNLLSSKTNFQNSSITLFGRNKSANFQNKRRENSANINKSNNNIQNHRKGRQEHDNYLIKVRLNRACVYFWFCFARGRKIMDNILLDEGMDFISKRLDIFNLFEKIYKVELINEKLNNKIISMSDECKAKLKLLESQLNKKDII